MSSRSKTVFRQWTCPKCARTINVSTSVRGRISPGESAGLASRLMKKKIHHKEVGCENDKGWCFLTTACVTARGLGDNCRELAALRAFRDDRLGKTPDGQRLIAQYYASAPDLVRAVQQRSDANQIWDWVYHEMVMPTVHLVELGRDSEAISTYSRAFEALQHSCGVVPCDPTDGSTS
jgi:hypothetical protein